MVQWNKHPKKDVCVFSFIIFDVFTEVNYIQLTYFRSFSVLLVLWLLLLLLLLYSDVKYIKVMLYYAAFCALCRINEPSETKGETFFRFGQESNPRPRRL